MLRWRWILAILFLLHFLHVPGYGQTAQVTLSGSHLTNSSGGFLASGTISFAPVDRYGNPISYRMGGSSGGQTISTPVTAMVTNGVFTLQIANTAITTPANVCFSVSVTAADGSVTLGRTPGGVGGTFGYDCIQPGTQVRAAYWCIPSSGSTVCNFDMYSPKMEPLALVQNGPVLKQPMYAGSNTLLQFTVSPLYLPLLTLTQPIYVTAFNVYITSVPSGCSTTAVLSLYDNDATTPDLLDFPINPIGSSGGFYGKTGLGMSVPAGHHLYFVVSTAEVGCSTWTAISSESIEYNVAGAN